MLRQERVRKNHVVNYEEKPKKNFSLSSSNDIEGLAEDLSYALDFDKLDGEIYLSLLRNSPTSASELAKEVNINRAKTYRTLERLTNEGLVYTTFSNPKLYVPTKPGEVLKLALRKKHDEINKIETIGKQLIKKLQMIEKLDYTGKNVPKFQIIQGLPNIFSGIEKLIEETTDTVFIVTTIKDISKMYYSAIPEKIKICENNGGKVLLYTEMENDNFVSFIKRFNATETRIGKLPSRGRMVVSDCKQMIISDSLAKRVRHAMSDSDYAFCTNSYGMLSYANFTCKFLWKHGKPIEHVTKKFA